MQLVRAGAADDALRVDPVTAAERLAQVDRAAVGIAVQLGSGVAVGGDGARARPERALVGGEADHARDAGDLGFAADIRRNVEDARLRARKVVHELASVAARGERRRAKGLA